MGTAQEDQTSLSSCPELTCDEMRAAACECARALRDTLGAQILRIILYGSVARRQVTQGSDVDLFVVVRNRDGDVRRQVSLVASHVSLKTGTTICPCVRTQEEFDRPLFQATPFWASVMLHGINL